LTSNQMKTFSGGFATAKIQATLKPHQWLSASFPSCVAFQRLVSSYRPI
jgi:hypothetical protein